MRILIAEAEARIASFLEKALHRAGFATDVAADGVETLYLARSGHYALVVLDVSLPAIEGPEVLAVLRAEAPALPVVVLSGRRNPDDRALALDGATEYVTKPFGVDDLLAHVRRLLRDAADTVEPVTRDNPAERVW